MLTAESNLLSWAWSHIKTTEMGQKTLLCYATELQTTMRSSLYVCPHRADGDWDARLVHRADAFVMRGFNDRHLFLFLWEASNGHSAAHAGVARHHRLSGNWLAAFYVQRGRGVKNTLVPINTQFGQRQLKIKCSFTDSRFKQCKNNHYLCLYFVPINFLLCTTTKWYPLIICICISYSETNKCIYTINKLIDIGKIFIKNFHSNMWCPQLKHWDKRWPTHLNSCSVSGVQCGVKWGEEGTMGERGASAGG